VAKGKKKEGGKEIGGSVVLVRRKEAHPSSWRRERRKKREEGGRTPYLIFLILIHLAKRSEQKTKLDESARALREKRKGVINSSLPMLGNLNIGGNRER